MSLRETNLIVIVITGVLSTYYVPALCQEFSQTLFVPPHN